MEFIVGIIGGSNINKDIYEFTHLLGETLAKNGYSILTGGMGGVMEAAGKGFCSVKNKKGKHLCIIPSDDKKTANKYCEYVIASGFGIGRNILIIRSADVLIAIDGGAGTLSEIAYAWQYNKTVLCVNKFNGWAKSLAGKKIDNNKYSQLVEVANIDEILHYLKVEKKKALNL